MWQIGSVNPAQEHFITNLIRQKLIVAIDGCHERKKSGSRKFMLYLAEGELHEISLLFACYLIKSRGHKAIYLGQTLPYADLKAAYEVHKPEYIFTVITYTPEENTQNYLNKLSKDFSASTILVTGYQVVDQPLKLTSNTKSIKHFNEMIEMLNALP
jgi:methanogenic corrinoid protein MtbC1